jgi:hypothetical protein
MLRADEYNRRYVTPKHKGVLRADIGLKDYSKKENAQAQYQKTAISPHGSTKGRITKVIPRTAATNLKLTSGFY